MTVLYRAGGMPTLEDTQNHNAVWFDGLSGDWIGRNNHIARSVSVFTALRLEDALMWAEDRARSGRNTAVWEITVPDDVPLLAYNYKHYDRAYDARSPFSFDYAQDWVDAYWLSGTDINHWWKMYSRCMEGYDNPEDWEVRLTFDVAASAEWTMVRDSVTVPVPA